MTIHDLRCDVCAALVPEPGRGVRFGYHPGTPALRDDSGLACSACWEVITRDLDRSAPAGQCSACRQQVTRRASLHLRRLDRTGQAASWRLCARHTVGFLNALRTVQPKLDEATFRFPATTEAGGGQPARDVSAPP